MGMIFKHLNQNEEARALALGDILHDCVMLYLGEIADDEPPQVRRCAELALCRKIKNGNKSSCSP